MLCRPSFRLAAQHSTDLSRHGCSLHCNWYCRQSCVISAADVVYGTPLLRSGRITLCSLPMADRCETGVLDHAPMMPALFA